MDILQKLKQLQCIHLLWRRNGTTTLLRQLAETTDVVLVAPTESSARALHPRAVRLEGIADHLMPRRPAPLLLDNHTVLVITNEAITAIEAGRKAKAEAEYLLMQYEEALAHATEKHLQLDQQFQDYGRQLREGHAERLRLEKALKQALKQQKYTIRVKRR